MRRQILKNSVHHVIGYVDVDDHTGKQTLLDEWFHKLGYFDPKTNSTTDEYFRRIGTGNLLTTLLRPPR